MTANLPPTGSDGRSRPGSQAPDPAPQPELIEGTSLWKDAFRRLKKNRAAMGGLIIVMIMASCAIFYELLVQYGTRFNQEEQHSYVVPRPPGSYAVPSEYFALMSPQGQWSFEAIDTDDDGRITPEEVQLAYQRWEFERIDRDGDERLSYSEYAAAPFSVPSPTEFIPACRQWSTIKRNMAPINHPDIFACDADEDGLMGFESAGRLVEIVSRGESRDIVARFDPESLGYLTPETFVGLPRPQRNWLGTDQLGRDLLSRMLYGARISLAVGLLATLVSFLIGVSWGATAGFVGGKVDNIMMRIVDIMYGLPFMFLVILLMVVFGQNIFLLFIALGAVQWLTMARIVRGQVISLKGQEFVEAAQTIGVSRVAIIFRHLIPNALGPIIVYATLTVPAVMLEEAFLSFLGLGVQAPMTSWGALASEGRQLMETAPWLIIYPGAALAVTLLSLNFVGDGLRDALDPQLRKD
ncbi:ABC transporter permease subunit [Lujinxingia litoralis]|nr:ABC transporter permease subunit [Lujinxingia litoralis]